MEKRHTVTTVFWRYSRETFLHDVWIVGAVSPNDLKQPWVYRFVAEYRDAKITNPTYDLFTVLVSFMIFRGQETRYRDFGERT